VLTVGRDETANLLVDEPLVSRIHARLERRGTAWFVIDIGSTNYTRVNGEAVAERELKDGDELRFARAKCVFRGASAADAVPAPSAD
jgi:pSer/pThr/pTyr-binding forkhead associated (FHA) protein